MKIVFLDVKTIGEDIDLSGFDRLGEVVKYDFSTSEEVTERVQDADVIILNKVQVNEQTIGKAEKLKLVCVTATGTNNLDKEYLEKRGVAWRNVAGYSTETVAQHTFAMLLYLLEKIRYYDDYVKDGNYINDTSFTHFAEHFSEINGKTWGIIGLGAIDTMIEYGHAVSDAEFQEREHAVKGSDLATIVYTSGSTGTPKGIELTHSNFVFITYSGISSMPDIAMKPNRRLLLFLPLAHVFARYMQFFCFAGNVSLGLSSNLKTILADFKAFKPTFILAVPRIFEKIYNAASQKAGAGLKGRIFAGATQTARDWSYAQQSGEGIPVVLNLKHALYNKLVYSSIMDVFGGHVEYAVSGGAPLDSSIAHFFNGVGLPLLEGYGMTETCAPSSVNPTSGYKIGTIGLPLQGVAMGVDEEGELCIKSPAVCAGYHNNPDVTRQQIVDGWLHTGDLGSIDDEGFVSIVGRKKDLIITAGGKNVSPCEMEASIMTSPVVSQCVMIGDRKPFIAAIIALDLGETNAWLASKGAECAASLEEASRNPIVRAEVERAVNKANELASRAESIRKFEIVPDEFTEENGLVTPSMKARRQAVVDHYRMLIDTVIYVLKK